MTFDDVVIPPLTVLGIVDFEPNENPVNCFGASKFFEIGNEDSDDEDSDEVDDDGRDIVVVSFFFSSIFGISGATEAVEVCSVVKEDDDDLDNSSEITFAYLI